MIKTEIYSAEHIASKQQLLESAKKQLKKEFIGIDGIIDSVIKSIATWFIFPEIQERPLVVNLWGLTGVGKTALILRLSALLHYEKKIFRFDMGDSHKDAGVLKDRLKNIFKNKNKAPLMLMMDEFQYAKTKNEDGFEINNAFSRVLWDLLDSGKMEKNSNTEYDMEKFNSVKNKLANSLAEGIQVEKGIVKEKHEVFLEIMADIDEDDNPFDDAEGRHVMDEQKKLYSFLPKNFIGKMYKHFLKDFSSVIAFRKMIYGLDGYETIALLETIIENETSYKPMDCSKTVIFILGNLDDAYRMSSGMNPDINADDFHEESKKININHIKKALKKRFKPEQIARLGNNHIIYPAFSQEGFRALITLELSKVAATYLDKFGIVLKFTETFKKLIYQEGVYPTQGTRPLFSTIYQMVNTKISIILSEKLLFAQGADTILFDYENAEIKYFFLQAGKEIHLLSVAADLNLEKLRVAEKDDMQAITAVHEAGHAVVAMVATGTLPEYICSTTADADSLGFIILKNKLPYLSKEAGIKNIARFFGGLLAEKLVFGENKITSGAEQDIERATELATMMVKDYGMGQTLATIDAFGFSNRLSYLDKNLEANVEVRKLLDEGKAVAEKILLQEKQLLLQLADYLSDERIITKEVVLAKTVQFGSEHLNAVVFKEDHSKVFYRAHLKEQVQQVTLLPLSVNINSFMLNKKDLKTVDIN